MSCTRGYKTNIPQLDSENHVFTAVSTQAVRQYLQFSDKDTEKGRTRLRQRETKKDVKVKHLCQTLSRALPRPLGRPQGFMTVFSTMALYLQFLFHLHGFDDLWNFHPYRVEHTEKRQTLNTQNSSASVIINDGWQETYQRLLLASHCES